MYIVNNCWLTDGTYLEAMGCIWSLLLLLRTVALAVAFLTWIYVFVSVNVFKKVCSQIRVIES